MLHGPKPGDETHHRMYLEAEDGCKHVFVHMNTKYILDVYLVTLYATATQKFTNFVNMVQYILGTFSWMKKHFAQSNYSSPLFPSVLRAPNGS